MNVLKSYGAHLAAYLVSAASIVSTLDPKLFPPQYAGLIGIAGLVATAAHNGHAIGAAGVQAAVAAATQAVKTVAPALVLGLALSVGLVGCKTAPTAQQSAGITVAVDIATAAAIQNGVQPAEYKARAANFKSIAVSVKAVNDAGTATLATLAADLEPQITKLPPPDQIAAHVLVAALKPYLDAELQGNDGLKNVQTTLDVILQAVIDSCAAYGA